MIWNGEIWKTELSSLLDELSRANTFSESNDEAQFNFERSLFYSAFVIRKLIEGGNVTDSTSQEEVLLTTYPSVDNEGEDHEFMQVLMGQKKAIEDEFDLTVLQEISLTPHSLASEIIHSFALVYETDDHEEIYALWICSYRNHSKRVIRMTLDEYIAFARNIANDKVTRHSMVKDLETGKVRQIIE